MGERPTEKKFYVEILGFDKVLNFYSISCSFIAENEKNLRVYLYNKYKHLQSNITYYLINEIGKDPKKTISSFLAFDAKKYSEMFN